MFHQVVAYGFGECFDAACDPDRFPFAERIHNNARIAAWLCRGRIAPDLRKMRSDSVSGIRSHEGQGRCGIAVMQTLESRPVATFAWTALPSRPLGEPESSRLGRGEFDRRGGNVRIRL